MLPSTLPDTISSARDFVSVIEGSTVDVLSHAALCRTAFPVVASLMVLSRAELWVSMLGEFAAISSFARHDKQCAFDQVMLGKVVAASSCAPDQKALQHLEEDFPSRSRDGMAAGPSAGHMRKPCFIICEIAMFENISGSPDSV